MENSFRSPDPSCLILDTYKNSIAASSLNDANWTNLIAIKKNLSVMKANQLVQDLKNSSSQGGFEGSFTVVAMQ